MSTQAGADQASVGALLRAYRQAAGLTQEQLAEHAGLSARGIQDLERGRRAPHQETVDRLMHALGIEGEQRRVFAEAARARAAYSPSQ